MPHQCVHCGNIYGDAAPELLKGCSCGSHFFFYIRKEQLKESKQKTVELEKVDKKKVEQDIREMIGAEEEDIPVVLDLESIRTLGPGKFEIDLVNLFAKKRPLIYKLEEGKYIIDLASTLKVDLGKIKDKKK
jgi:predicted  nucleic acid-binding Zn-ribbon protein